MAIQKFISQVAGQIKEVIALVTSAGVADAGKIVALDATGKLDTTLMPTGIGATTEVMITSEALIAGEWVNIYDNAGTRTARKANATDITKPSMGFVLAGVANGGNATVYIEGENTALTGLTVGSQYFLGTTAGASTATCPSATGNAVQFLGYAVSATTVNFTQRNSIQLA